jgi:hypothetical protein
VAVKKSVKKPGVKPKVKTNLKSKTQFETALTSVYELNRDALFRAAPNGKVFAILTHDMGAFFQIEGIAAQLWSLFDGKTPANKLVKKLKVKKSVSQAEVLKSAAQLIASFEKNNLIKKIT